LHPPFTCLLKAPTALEYFLSDKSSQRCVDRRRFRRLDDAERRRPCRARVISFRLPLTCAFEVSSFSDVLARSRRRYDAASAFAVFAAPLSVQRRARRHFLSSSGFRQWQRGRGRERQWQQERRRELSDAFH